jgi:hypothetical protein
MRMTVMPELVHAGTNVLTLLRLEVPLKDVAVFREFLERMFWLRRQ